MSRYTEEENAEYSSKSMKLFTSSEFLIEYAIIIRASYYSLSSTILFSEGRDQEDS